MCDSTYMRFIVEFIETESGMAAVRGWGGGEEWGECSPGRKCPFGKVEFRGCMAVMATQQCGCA